MLVASLLDLPLRGHLNKVSAEVVGSLFQLTICSALNQYWQGNG